MKKNIPTKLSYTNIKKGLMYLKHYGPKDFFCRLSERLQPDDVPYGPWYEKHKASAAELEAQRAHVWDTDVCFSIIVPAYRTPSAFLHQMIASVQNQTYDNWELCIANASPDDKTMCAILRDYVQSDARIKLIDLPDNKGISDNTNAALSIASGSYIALLDHDDLLAPNALFEAALAIEKNPAIDVIYSDEDKVNMELTEHFQPNFKPDYSPDLLCSNNYICHLFFVRHSIASAIGGFRSDYDGAQDYDFIFRCIGAADCVYHIPKILYHWRTHSASTADNPASKMYAFEAGRKAIDSHLQQIGVLGHAELKKELGFYRVHYDIPDEPLLSILIPNRNEKDSLKKCISSILTKTSYPNYEIIIIENNSTAPDIFEYYHSLESNPKIHVITWTEGFNFSSINNFGVAHAKGDYLLFLNNDTEVISDEWLNEMLGICQRPDIGIVGAKLYYPDNTIQHAGTVIGIGGTAGHIFTDMKRGFSGYMHKASLQLNYSAVTAACMMVKRSVFTEMNGFDVDFTVAFNDVDFCLRVREAGYLIAYTPYAELYHFESKSRGTENNAEKAARFKRESQMLRERHPEIYANGDPYYNPNFSLAKWNYSLKNR